jgi:1,4-alpha-glucan branching enzyme
MSVAALVPEYLDGFGRGDDARAYEKLGSHVLRDADGAPLGVAFAVWAPNASRVTVIGSWNYWNPDESPLTPVGSTGVWHGVIENASAGDLYKYRIVSSVTGEVLEKADPYASLHETPPRTASVVYESAYAWGDEGWMASRSARDALDAPMSIYEMHIGSWRRVPEEGGRSLTYRELAPLVADYVEKLGFTHVELMPVMEHPFFGSWGYQVTGYFAPSHRYGTPDDFRFLVDTLHRRGIGVILDWVPAHFPADAHSLARFDGTHVYEHADPRQGFHPEWNSAIFNYDRREVRSFLLSSALYWLDEMHADGLRVDGVSSMLYLDYARGGGPDAWIPNVHGGRENLGAVAFLRTLNERVYQDHPGVQVIAEESTSWPRVTKPTTMGGLGFGLKWDMGWMHDTLAYLARDPVFRQHHQNALTFRSLYAYTENFVLPLSHDEVVYGKGSLLEKMHGDDWQRFASVRLLLSYMWSIPGKKLLFMGGEFAQRREWNHDSSLDWHLMDAPAHGQIAQLVGSLNHLYRTLPALHEGDSETHGFEWLDGSNAAESTLVFLRRGHAASEEDGDRQEPAMGETLLVALNFTPVPRHEYRVGVPEAGVWREVLNSDAKVFGGTGAGNLGAVVSSPVPWNGRPHSVLLTLPPLAALFLKPARGDTMPPPAASPVDDAAADA